MRKRNPSIIHLIIPAVIIFCIKDPVDALANGHTYSSSQSHLASFALRTHHLQLLPRGTIFISSSFEYRKNWQAPISKLEGNLYRIGILRFDCYVSRFVDIKITGVFQEYLKLHGNPDITDYNIKSNTAQDVGDFSVAAIACLISPQKNRPYLGFRVETRLPNTEQNKGLGPNTVDLSLSFLTGIQLGPLHLFGDFGLTIMSAPKKLNEQNDVVAYGMGLIWRLHKNWHLAGEVNGFYSTRITTPAGTESRGIVRMGLAWSNPRFSIAFYPTYGLTPDEGGFGILIGSSLTLIRSCDDY